MHGAGRWGIGCRVDHDDDLALAPCNGSALRVPVVGPCRLTGLTRGRQRHVRHALKSVSDAVHVIHAVHAVRPHPVQKYLPVGTAEPRRPARRPQQRRGATHLGSAAHDPGEWRGTGLLSSPLHASVKRLVVFAGGVHGVQCGRGVQVATAWQRALPVSAGAPRRPPRRGREPRRRTVAVLRRPAASGVLRGLLRLRPHRFQALCALTPPAREFETPCGGSRVS